MKDLAYLFDDSLKELPSGAQENRISKLQKNLALEAEADDQLLQVTFNKLSEILREKNSTKKAKKKSNLVYLASGLAATAAAAIFIIFFQPASINNPSTKLVINNKTIDLSGGGFTQKSNQKQHASINKNISFDFKEVKALTATQTPEKITLSLEKCRCTFAFHGGKQSLAIQTPRAKYSVIGTVFTLNSTQKGDKLIVKEGAVNVEFNDQTQSVAGGQEFLSQTGRVTQTSQGKPSVKVKKKGDNNSIINSPKKVDFAALSKGQKVMIYLKDGGRLKAQFQSQSESSVNILIIRNEQSRTLKIGKSEINRIKKI